MSANPGSNKIKVTLKEISQIPIILSVYPDDSVAQVRQRVADIHELEVGKVKLFLDGESLQGRDNELASPFFEGGQPLYLIRDMTDESQPPYREERNSEKDAPKVSLSPSREAENKRKSETTTGGSNRNATSSKSNTGGTDLGWTGDLPQGIKIPDSIRTFTLLYPIKDPYTFGEGIVRTQLGVSNTNKYVPQLEKADNNQQLSMKFIDKMKVELKKEIEQLKYMGHTDELKNVLALITQEGNIIEAKIALDIQRSINKGMFGQTGSGSSSNNIGDSPFSGQGVQEPTRKHVHLLVLRNKSDPRSFSGNPLYASRLGLFLTNKYLPELEKVDNDVKLGTELIEKMKVELKQELELMNGLGLDDDVDNIVKLIINEGNVNAAINAALDQKSQSLF